MKRLIVTCLVVAASLCPAARARADPLGAVMPAGCVAHAGWGGSDPDVPGDYRCAGLAIQFHTLGVSRSPGLLWAGQWLFVDEAGQFRVGSCTFNRGIHPTTAVRSHPVSQTFPRDPSGSRGAYLAWRYGAATDNLTAAALWAVFHYFAQDAAGSQRAVVDTAPLVPALDRVAAMSGNDELQGRAIALAAEAERFAAPWKLDLTLARDGTVTASERAGDVPVAGASIELAVDGQASPVTITTDGDGRASTMLAVGAGTTRIEATSAAPGHVIVYRGQPAAPNPWGAQTLVTGGVADVLRAEATVDVPEPTTAAPTTEEATTAQPTTTAADLPPTTGAPTTAAGPVTTSIAPATSAGPVTTSIAPATSAGPVTTSIAPATTAVATATSIAPTTEVPVTTVDRPATTEPVVATTDLPRAAIAVGTTTTRATTVATTTRPGAVSPGPQLPRTGAHFEPAAYIGTATLVGGIGLLGTIRRRSRRPRTPFFGDG